MLLSIAIIFLSAMLLGALFNKLRLPSLLGMIIAGILIGPYVLDIIDDSVLNISAELRKIALVVILTRAGLNLDLSDLKKIGRPAVLMCFVPACFEILGMMLIAPRFFDITLLDAALMGAVVAAVSPAVIVPKMLKLMDEGYGTKKAIPQMVLAGASVDDVFVIILFSSFLSAEKGGGFNAISLVNVPVSIVSGIVLGIFCGFLLDIFFRKTALRGTAKMLIMLSFAFVLTAIEDALAGYFGFSGLIAIMAMGIALRRQNPEIAGVLAEKYSKLWVPAELLLFALVGMAVDITYAMAFGLPAICVILLVILFRMAGVFMCVVRTRLSARERLFCMIAYMPKATVQAAIGAIALSEGLAVGELVLTVAVLSILITAPMGAFLIELLYRKLLEN